MSADMARATEAYIRCGEAVASASESFHRLGRASATLGEALNEVMRDLDRGYEQYQAHRANGANWVEALEMRVHVSDALPPDDPNPPASLSRRAVLIRDIGSRP